MANAEQTEKPTQRRLNKAREEGNYPSSKEFVAALQFTIFLALLGAYAPRWFSSFRETSQSLFIVGFKRDLVPEDVTHLAWQLYWNHILPLLAAGVVIAVATLGLRLATTRFGLSLKKLTPDLFLGLPFQSVDSGFAVLGASLMDLFWKAAGVFIVVGAVDLFRQMRKHNAQLRMSKQEIREEMKDTDSNPMMKQKVRRLQRDRARKQMMKEVPTATAVIVNPEHFAVAIRYNMEAQAAPMVVAKGKNYLALRIKQ